MKPTRRVLFAKNTQLQAQLAACGPEITLSRTQRQARLVAAQTENDALTARVSALTAERDALAGELATLKEKAKADATAKKEAAAA